MATRSNRRHPSLRRLPLNMIWRTPCPLQWPIARNSRAGDRRRSRLNGGKQRSHNTLCSSRRSHRGLQIHRPQQRLLEQHCLSERLLAARWSSLRRPPRRLPLLPPLLLCPSSRVKPPSTLRLPPPLAASRLPRLPLLRPRRLRAPTATRARARLRPRPRRHRRSRYRSTTNDSEIRHLANSIITIS